MIAPAVIAIYFGCMWSRTTAVGAAILLIVYGYLIFFGLIRADFVKPGTAGVTVVYVSMVAMVYADLLINALKEFLLRRIEHYYQDDN